jgi:hypothetical protein
LRKNKKTKKIEQPNNQKLNKSHFQGFANSQYFFLKISGCVELIDAQKQAKNAFFVFLGCFWAYGGQPHNHIG